MVKKKEYKDYILEIEELKKRLNLTAIQIALLQISAAFAVGKTSYQKLKQEFEEENKKSSMV